MKDYRIEIARAEHFGYTVCVNGETVYECLAEDEVRELTVDTVISDYEQGKKEIEEFIDRFIGRA